MSLKKIKKQMEYPLSFDMNEYCDRPWDRLGRFNLIGVIMHKGESIESGHYVSLTKRTPEGSWWYCNDAQV